MVKTRFGLGVLISSALLSFGRVEADWQHFPRPNLTDRVDAMVSHAGCLYVTGPFDTIGELTVNQVACWDGFAWQPVGSGIVDIAPQAMAVFGNDLYVGGWWGSQARLYRWDGITWVDIGSAVTGAGPVVGIRAAMVFDGKLVIAGDFDSVDGQDAGSIAAFDGVSWTTFGTGVGGTVLSLGTYGGQLVVGGHFTVAQGAPADRIAMWNGTNWIGLGAGLAYGVTAIHEFAGDLFVGQDRWGLPSTETVMRWDGQSWHDASMGLTVQCGSLENSCMPIPYDFHVYGGEFYVGGAYLTGLTSPGNFAATWDGSAWTDIGNGMQGSAGDFAPTYTVNALATHDEDLILAGFFPDAGGPNGVASENIVAWDGSDWHHVDDTILGLDGPVDEIVIHEGTPVFIGGFHEGGAQDVGDVARWTPFGWRPVGIGGPTNLSGAAFTILSHQGDLILGGSFDAIDGIPALNVAQWTSGGWMQIGAGLSGFVRDLKSHGSDVVAAVGDPDGDGVFLWDGGSWSQVGPVFAVSDRVFAVTSFDGAIYAGGYDADGFDFGARVWKWTGASWTELANGVDGFIQTLHVGQDELIAGGRFTEIGGIPAANIARFDGAQWSALGDGLGTGSDAVYRVTSFDGDVVAGGRFAVSGATPIANLGRWDGLAWSEVGGGANAVVQGLAAWYGDLWVGGWFSQVNGERSRYLARWSDPAGTGTSSPSMLATGLRDVVPNPFNPHTLILYDLERAGVVSLFVYDTRGRFVAKLEHGFRRAGHHRQPWNGLDERGRAVASGVYYVRLSAAGEQFTTKVALVR